MLIATAAVQPSVALNGLIQEIAVGVGGLATVNFQNIPQTFRHLQIEGLAATEDGSAQDIQMQMNGNTGAVYFDQVLTASVTAVGAAGASSATSGRIARVGASSSGLWCHMSVKLPYYSYANAGPHVANGIWGQHVSPSNALGQNMVLYNASPHPITSIQLFPAAGDMKEGSIFSLYGIA